MSTMSQSNINFEGSDDYDNPIVNTDQLAFIHWGDSEHMHSVISEIMERNEFSFPEEVRFLITQSLIKRSKDEIII